MQLHLMLLFAPVQQPLVCLTMPHLDFTAMPLFLLTLELMRWWHVCTTKLLSADCVSTYGPWP